LAYVLRPVVAGLLKAGVTSQAVDEVVRQVFVEMAIQQGGPEASTDSRISVATGLARREVKRLREQIGAQDRGTPKTVSLGARIVAAWLSRPGYQDESGAPRALPRLAKDPAQPSFDALVRDISQDVRSRAILDEWVRLGVASISGDDLVALNKEAFVPTQGAKEKAFYLGNNLHDHAAAAFENLLGARAEPWFERCVHYKGMSPVEVEETRRLAERVGGRILAEISQFVQRLPEPTPTAEPSQRFTFGMYFYSAAEATKASDDKENP
jgi:hypothetical protein